MIRPPPARYIALTLHPRLRERAHSSNRALSQQSVFPLRKNSSCNHCRSKCQPPYISYFLPCDRHTVTLTPSIPQDSVKPLSITITPTWKRRRAGGDFILRARRCSSSSRSLGQQTSTSGFDRLLDITDSSHLTRIGLSNPISQTIQSLRHQASQVKCEQFRCQQDSKVGILFVKSIDAERVAI